MDCCRWSDRESAVERDRWQYVALNYSYTAAREAQYIADEATIFLLPGRLVQLGPCGEPDSLVRGHGDELAGLPASYRLDPPLLDLPHGEGPKTGKHYAVPILQGILDATQHCVECSLALGP